MELQTLIIINIALSAVAAVLALAAILKKPAVEKDAFENQRREMLDELRATRTELSKTMAESLGTYATAQTQAQERASVTQDKRLGELIQQLSAQQDTLQKQVNTMLTRVDARLAQLQGETQKQLDAMRETVDEKLQKTLNTRITESFAVVSERLEQVYAGLGEMRTLASGVGDLKKVLSNVKTRGILGEMQLGAILEQILAPGQYEENVAVNPASKMRVEFAVKLPGDEDGKPVYLPIDAKFPLETYSVLVDAYEDGTPEEIDAAWRGLENMIKSEAKDIHDKYIVPPYTTDFAIMFLPVEGLYAEVVRRGMVETLQSKYKVNIAGPTTMAALLNSLQMGFKTLAIQKQSGEVWQVLGAVKTEFNSFGDVLNRTQKHLLQTSDDLEKLVGTRTRAIQKKLRKVEELPYTQAQETLSLDEMQDETDDILL